MIRNKAKHPGPALVKTKLPRQAKEPEEPNINQDNIFETIKEELGKLGMLDVKLPKKELSQLFEMFKIDHF